MNVNKYESEEQLYSDLFDNICQIVMKLLQMR